MAARSFPCEDSTEVEKELLVWPQKLERIAECHGGQGSSGVPMRKAKDKQQAAQLFATLDN